ncbi:MAG: hypothetical protein ABI353_04990 [Isosphaeraceae bacterium]
MTTIIIITIGVFVVSFLCFLWAVHVAPIIEDESAFWDAIEPMPARTNPADTPDTEV